MSIHQKRDLKVAAGGVAISSAIMGVIFYTAWTDIYLQVKNIEAQVEAGIPLLTDGALQVVAMAALGLYLTWNVLFALDIQKRYQGVLILVGSIVALVLLAGLGVFLPNMHLNIQNAVSLFSGIGFGLVSEAAKLPWRDEPGDLRDIAFRDSSWKAVKTIHGAPAQFPTAVKGVYRTIILLVVGANAVLLLGTTPIVGKIASILISPIFGYYLLKLVEFNPTETSEESLNTVILGPTGSGKTLALYGLYKAALDGNDELGQVKPLKETNLLIETIEEGQNANLLGDTDDIREETKNPFVQNLNGDEKWPVPSTTGLHEFGFKFPFGTLPKRIVQVQLTDHSGGLFGKLFRHKEAVTDGGVPGEDNEEDSSEVPSFLNEDAETDAESDLDTNAEDNTLESIEDHVPLEENQDREDNPEGSMQSDTDDLNESEPHETNGQVAEGDNDGSRTDYGENLSDAEQIQIIEDQITEADKLVFLIDMYKLISDDSNLPAGIAQMNRICERTDPDDVALVVTKSDYAIEPFQNAYDYDNVEPDTAGNSVVDYDEFIEFVTDRLAKQTNIKGLMNVADANRLIPVYYKTERDENGERVPRRSTDNGLFATQNNLDGVGFDIVLQEIAGHR
ncbi:hypothetical protein ACODNH_19905 (plasmid) [Haloarcula sp. NS06]|uniref:hypothetical protein n=1 Tax=Haloarcula sp. NS06 TaxID=3409688 RepID=UPI003DA7955D